MAAPRKPRRSAIGRVFAWLALTLAIIVALAAVAVGLLATGPGRSVVARLAERAAAGSGITMTIGSLSGWPPFSFGADRIMLADAAGPFAEIEGLDLKLGVRALLSGALRFETLSAERVSIERSPELPPSTSSGGSPALIVAAADRFAIDALELGAGLIHRPARLAVEGSFAMGGNGAISAAIDARRTDGIAGTIEGRLSRADANAPVSLALDVQEAADGILVGLIGRENGPAYQLSAETGFDNGVFAGSLSLASAGDARFDGRFSLVPGADGASRLTVDGSGDLAGLVPREFADLLAGTIDVAVDADWTPVAGRPLPRIAVRDGRVSTETVKAEVTGVLGGADTSLSLKVDAARANGAAITLPAIGGMPAAVTSTTLAGTVARSGDVTRLDIRGNVAGLSVGDTRIPALGLSGAMEAEGEDPLAAGNVPFALRLEADSIARGDLRIDAAAGRPIVVTADGTLHQDAMSADVSAEAMANGARATFAGKVSQTEVTGKLTADAPDLAAFAALAGRPLAGGVSLTADGQFLGGDGVNVTVSGTATDLDPGEATVARLIRGTTQFGGAVTYDRNGTVTITDGSVTASAFSTGGRFAYGPDTFGGSLKGTIADLASLADASSGAATFSAEVSGTPDRPAIDATIAIADGQLLDQAVKDSTVRFQGGPVDQGWQGALTLAGSFAGKPLTGRAEASLDTGSGALALPSVDVDIGGNRITGGITRTSSGLLSGSLAVDAPNVQTLAAFLLMQATGTGQADIRFTPDGDRQAVAVDFTGNDLDVAGVAAGQVSGKVTIADALGTPMVNGTANARQVRIGDLFLDTADATARVDGGATIFTGSISGQELALTGAGRLSNDGNGQVVAIDRLNGTGFGFPIDLSAPATVRVADGRTSLSGVRLALGGGRVTVEGAVSPDLNLTATFDGVNASVANRFSPGLGAQGTVSGRATVTGTPATPVIAWNGNWSGMSVAATRASGLPGLAVTARGSATLTSTTIDATLNGAGLSLAIAGSVPFAGNGLNVTARGTAPLALMGATAARELRLGGNARLDIAVTGSTASPVISGTADLADATFVDVGTGFGIAGTSGRIRFNGTNATIERLSGRLAQGGQVTASGTVAIDTAAGFPPNLTIAVRNGRYSDGRMVNSVFSADLTVNGPLLGNGTVAGRIDLGRTEILLPDRFGGSAAAIDVTHRRTEPGFVPPRLPESASGSGRSSSGGSLRLDIAVNGRNVLVRGFGIDAEFGGSVRIAGTTGTPDVVGAFTLVRGRFEMIGRRFDFTSGRLTFSGDLIPIVDFAATTSTARGTVNLSVTGPATDPKINFTSNPSLPEEEIISALLFNQGVGSLSPVQAAQLVDAVAQLSGAVARGDGIFDRIRRATGLNDLDIRQNASGGTTVGVGARISDRVRLGVEQDSQAGGRVSIDIDLTKNLKATASTGQNGSSKVGITYEREY